MKKYIAVLLSLLSSLAFAQESFVKKDFNVAVNVNTKIGIHTCLTQTGRSKAVPCMNLQISYQKARDQIR